MGGKGRPGGFTSQMVGQGPPRVCRYFQQGRACRDGNACRFLHEVQGAETPKHFFASHEDRIWSHAEASSSGHGFRMMAYNCLADELALGHAKELYPAVPRFCLKWSYRLDLLLKEIKFWSPDILCLQEIDHLLDFESFLRPLGYEGDFASRTGGRQDGCLTAWKTSKFALVEAEVIQMRPLGLNDNVALLVVLRAIDDPSAHRGSESQRASAGGNVGPSSNGGAQGSNPARPPPTLVIGNTHLLFNPRRGDMKVAQARTILTAMRRLADAHDGAVCVLTGDFNSTPGSGVYRFIREGRLDCAAQDRRQMSGQLCQAEEGWPPSWLRKSFIPRPHLGGALMRTLTGAVGALGMAPYRIRHTTSTGQLGGGGPPPPPAWGTTRVPTPAFLAANGSATAFETPPPPPPGGPATGLWGPTQTPGSWAAPGSALAANPPYSASPAGYRSAPPHGGGGPAYPVPTPALTPFATMSHLSSGSSLSSSTSPHGGGLLGSSPVPAYIGSPLIQEGGLGSPKLSSPQEVRSYMLRHSASFCGMQALYTYRDVYGQQFASPVPPGPPTSKMPFYYDPMVVEEPAGQVEPERHGLPRTQSQMDRQVNFSTWTIEQLIIAVGHDVREPSGKRALKREKGGPGSHSLVGDYMRRDWVARHPLPVQSAYFDVLGQEPQFTSCHSKFIGTVDYLWYTPEGHNYALKPRRVLLPPPLECLHCGLPSPQWPSDHVSIMTDFSFCEPGAPATPDVSAHGGHVNSARGGHVDSARGGHVIGPSAPAAGVVEAAARAVVGFDPSSRAAVDFDASVHRGPRAGPQPRGRSSGGVPQHTRFK